MSPTLRRAALLAGLVLLVGCDHATKHVAKTALEGQPPRPLIHGVLELRYTENTDVAFNLLRAVPERVRSPPLVGLGGAAVLGLVGWLMLRRRALGVASLALLLVTAGAVGNVLDRLVRGYVVDFVHVTHWPVFNVADAYVSVGGAVLLGLALKARAAPPPTRA